MKAIYLNTTQIHSYTGYPNVFVSPRIQGLEIPEVRLSTYSRPNADGGVVANQLYGGRLITLQGKVLADDIDTYRATRRNLESAVRIMRDDNGNTTPIILKFTTMDDLELQIEVYTRSFVMPDTNVLASDFKVDFYSPDFYIQGQELHSQNLFVFQGGGMAIPMAIPLNMSVGASAVNVLQNNGNVEAFPIITFYGPLQDPTLTNETTGESLSIIHALSSGQLIVVDTKNHTVSYYATEGGSATNIRSELSGDFLTFAPGENSIKLTDAGGDPAGYVSMVWRDSFSGI